MDDLLWLVEPLVWIFIAWQAVSALRLIAKVLHRIAEIMDAWGDDDDDDDEDGEAWKRTPAPAREVSR